VPAAPAPIDYDKMAAASIRVANAQIAAEEESIKRLYPQYINMQFGTADQLAGRLNNEYLQRTRGVIGEELQAASAPNAIEGELQRQAESELMLGRSLSPEQQREASQSARAAFAARGLGASMGSSAAEILNRDAYGQQRLDARRGFAANVNQMDLARRQRRVGLAGAYTELDPFRQSIGPAFQLGTNTLSNTTGQVGSIFGNSLTQSGNVASFNNNMSMSMRNTALNNNAAVQAAAMQAGASQNAGQMAMFGGIAQGLGSLAGGYFSGGGTLSDKRLKKDIKQTGEDGVLGLKTYEYRFKGESSDAPKHTGFMAQEVQKVLPEAVEEVNYQGKKRLAIKPQVIGQALATALASQQDAMFSKGYTVGSGFKG
jgi:hypothetical protein